MTSIKDVGEAIAKVACRFDAMMHRRVDAASNYTPGSYIIRYPGEQDIVVPSYRSALKYVDHMIKKYEMVPGWFSIQPLEMRHDAGARRQ